MVLSGDFISNLFGPLDYKILPAFFFTLRMNRLCKGDFLEMSQTPKKD